MEQNQPQETLIQPPESLQPQETLIQSPESLQPQETLIQSPDALPSESLLIQSPDALPDLPNALLDLPDASESVSINKYILKLLYYIIYALSWGNAFIDPKTHIILKGCLTILIFTIILLTIYYGVSGILLLMYNSDNTSNNTSNTSGNNDTSGYFKDQIIQFIADTRKLLNIPPSDTTNNLPDVSYNDVSYNASNLQSANEKQKTIYLVITQLMGFMCIFGILIITIIALNGNVNISNSGYNFTT